MEKYPNAEVCGPFIKLVLDELNCNVLLYDQEPVVSEESLVKYPGHYGGLYILYMKPAPDSDVRYPVYVGTAGDSFRARLRRHAESGVIRAVWDGKFPNNAVEGLGLYVWCTHFQGEPARKIKTILRDTFDFAQNRGRKELDLGAQYPAEWTNNQLSFPWDELSKADEENSSEDARMKSETGGLFIRFLLDQLNVNVDMYDGEEIRDSEDIAKFPAHYGGLYLFYLKAEPASDLRYPIYVGVTKQSFKERFTRHADCHFNGVLHKIWKEASFKGYGVYAICANLQVKQAKIVKDFLHEYFNFPLKRNRFGELRERLETAEQTPVEYILNNRDIPWEGCVEEVEAAAETQL